MELHMIEWADSIFYKGELSEVRHTFVQLNEAWSQLFQKYRSFWKLMDKIWPMVSYMCGTTCLKSTLGWPSHLSMSTVGISRIKCVGCLLLSHQHKVLVMYVKSVWGVKALPSLLTHSPHRFINSFATVCEHIVLCMLFWKFICITAAICRMCQSC